MGGGGGGGSPGYNNNKRPIKFEKKFAECDNIFCKISVSVR